jgi:hypothetical protein
VKYNNWPDLDDETIPFQAWRKDRSEADALPFHALSAKEAAEKRARQDWIAGEACWPVTYCVQDGENGTIWAIDVTIATQPTFVALGVKEIEMPPATHVLWGGHVLCEDLRLRDVPRNWSAGQRWISLKDVANGVVAPDDRCAVCWEKVPAFVDKLREISKE